MSKGWGSNPKQQRSTERNSHVPRIVSFIPGRYHHVSRNTKTPNNHSRHDYNATRICTARPIPRFLCENFLVVFHLPSTGCQSSEPFDAICSIVYNYPIAIYLIILISTIINQNYAITMSIGCNQLLLVKITILHSAFSTNM